MQYTTKCICVKDAIYNRIKKIHMCTKDNIPQYANLHQRQYIIYHKIHICTKGNVQHTIRCRCTFASCASKHINF